MTPRPRRVRAGLRHAQHLAANLTEADLREVRAAGSDPETSLRDGVMNSPICWAYLAPDKEPFAIRGVMKDGVIWMLTSDRIKEPENKWFFARRIGKEIDDEQQKHPLMHNFIDARNEDHMRLLEWLGFEFGGSVMINGHRFISFWRAA